MRTWFFDWDGVIEDSKGQIRNPQWLKQFLIERYEAGEPVFIVTFKTNDSTNYQAIRDQFKLKKLLESESKYTWDQLIRGVTYGNDPKRFPLEEAVAEEKGYHGKNKLMRYSLKKMGVDVPSDLRDIILIDDSDPNCIAALDAGHQAVQVDHTNKYTRTVDEVAARTALALTAPAPITITIENTPTVNVCSCVIL